MPVDVTGGGIDGCGAVERSEVSAAGEPVDIAHGGDDGCRADVADPEDVGQGGAVDVERITDPVLDTRDATVDPPPLLDQFDHAAATFEIDEGHRTDVAQLAGRDICSHATFHAGWAQI